MARASKSRLSRRRTLDPWNKVSETYASKVGVTEAISRFNPLARLDPNSGQFDDDVASLITGLLAIDPKAENACLTRPVTGRVAVFDPLASLDLNRIPKPTRKRTV